MTVLHLSWLSLLFGVCLCNDQHRTPLKQNVLRTQEKYAPGECDRVRQPMHKLSTEELQLYADGLHRIRGNGKYQIIVNAHQLHREMHRGSSFFFYHTYFVWEVESLSVSTYSSITTVYIVSFSFFLFPILWIAIPLPSNKKYSQIRQLGGKFTCFALPYYDWTVDAGREEDPWILNTVLGGRGDPDNGLCLFDQYWSQSQWNVRETCDRDFEDPHVGCCLKRDLWPEEELGDAPLVGELCERDDFTPFSGGVAFYHQKVHWLFGRGDLCTKCAMATGYSPDDPIFMVLHSFAAYLRAVWASCHGYDNIPNDELQDHPEAYTPGCADGFFDGECGVVDYDDAYEWEEMAEQEWSLTSSLDITPRMMWNFADWNVAFNHGDFLERTGLIDSELCDQANVAQSQWFSDQGPLYDTEVSAYDQWVAEQEMKKTENMEVKELGKVMEDNVMEEYSDEHRYWMMSGIVVLLLIVGLSLYRYNQNMEKQQIMDISFEDSYGAVNA